MKNKITFFPSELSNCWFPSELFSWYKSTSTAAVEISELENKGYVFNPKLSPITVVSNKTGQPRLFKFLKVDYADSSCEDIAGWRYVCNINGVNWELIFIND